MLRIGSLPRDRPVNGSEWSRLTTRSGEQIAEFEVRDHLPGQDVRRCFLGKAGESDFSRIVRLIEKSPNCRRKIEVSLSAIAIDRSKIAVDISTTCLMVIIEMRSDISQTTAH